MWTGEGGALGLDMFRMQQGATEVFIQVASSRRYAVRCGDSTTQTCVTMRFMDGNRFTLSESTMPDRGIEVQYSPDGTQVITVVARNQSRGQKLPIDRGLLINLIQDQQLRLPKL